MKFGVVILAAGESKRMGLSKLLLPWLNGRSVVHHLIWLWEQLGSRESVVVIRNGDTGLKNELNQLIELPFTILANREPEGGMISSISTAARFRGWTSDVSHVVIVLGDQPHLEERFLVSLLQFASTNYDAVVQACVEGKPVHPVVMPIQMFKRIPAQHPASLKEFLESLPERRFMAWNDRTALADMDYPEDYLQLRKLTTAKAVAS